MAAGGDGRGGGGRGRDPPLPAAPQLHGHVGHHDGDHGAVEDAKGEAVGGELGVRCWDLCGIRDERRKKSGKDLGERRGAVKLEAREAEGRADLGSAGPGSLPAGGREARCHRRPGQPRSRGSRPGRNAARRGAIRQEFDNWGILTR
jgi:hypothetical protein